MSVTKSSVNRSASHGHEHNGLAARIAFDGPKRAELRAGNPVADRARSPVLRSARNRIDGCGVGLVAISDHNGPQYPR
jgi:hypothetical protein